MRLLASVMLATAAAAFVPGDWLELVRGGAPWRIVTCHFTHWTHEQLAWDAIPLFAMAAVVAKRNAVALRATLLASVIAIPIAVLALTDLTAYRGLSGLASAVFALLLALEWRKSWPVTLAALLFVVKLAFEFSAGSAVFVADMGPGVVPVPIAHLTGAVIGALCGLPYNPRPKCGPSGTSRLIPASRGGAS